MTDISATDPRPGRSEAELEVLLAEASKVRGNTLWSDARRRFRKNRVSRIALWFLAFVAVVSFLTPMLPLAPHARVRLAEQALPPMHETLTKDSVFMRGGWPERPSAGLSDAEAEAQFDGRVDTLCSEAGILATPMIRLRAAIFGDKEFVPWLGTDVLGRCLLSRILWGGRVSLLVGLVATLVSLIIGVAYGAISGYLGGRTDQIMMRIVDVLYSIPFIFVVIFLMTLLRALQTDSSRGEKLLVFFMVIGAIYWLTMARVVRGQVLSLKHKEFVEAAQVLGASTRHVIVRHLLPNVFSVVLVYLTLTIPRVMLFEAFLSFLGLGVEPPDVSWGMLASDALGAVNPLRVYWWYVLFPSLALGMTLLALNYLGDGLRDALDPRLAEKRGKKS